MQELKQPEVDQNNSKELKNILDIYAIVLKKAMSLRPLIDRPELFREDNRVKMTIDDLDFDGELQELFEEAENDYTLNLGKRENVDYDELVLGRFNPFRAGILSKIIYASRAFADLSVIDPVNEGRFSDYEPLRVAGIKFAKEILSIEAYENFLKLIIKCQKILTEKKLNRDPINQDEAKEVFLLGEVTENLMEVLANRVGQTN